MLFALKPISASTQMLSHHTKPFFMQIICLIDFCFFWKFHCYLLAYKSRLYWMETEELLFIFVFSAHQESFAFDNERFFSSAWTPARRSAGESLKWDQHGYGNVLLVTSFVHRFHSLTKSKRSSQLNEFICMERIFVLLLSSGLFDSAFYLLPFDNPLMFSFQFLSSLNAEHERVDNRKFIFLI